MKGIHITAATYSKHASELHGKQLNHVHVNWRKARDCTMLADMSSDFHNICRSCECCLNRSRAGFHHSLQPHWVSFPSVFSTAPPLLPPLLRSSSRAGCPVKAWQHTEQHYYRNGRCHSGCGNQQACSPASGFNSHFLWKPVVDL